MTSDEYIKALTALRQEYADSIRALVTDTKDNYALISDVGVEAAEYHLRVSALIEEYRA